MPPMLLPVQYVQATPLRREALVFAVLTRDFTLEIDSLRMVCPPTGPQHKQSEESPT